MEEDGEDSYMQSNTTALVGRLIVQELTHTVRKYPGGELESRKSPGRSIDREDMKLTGNE
jgi:hypothetical protein